MPIQLSRIRGITISLIFFFFFFLQLERIEEIVTEFSYLVYRFNARNNRILSRLKDITQKRGEIRVERRPISIVVWTHKHFPPYRIGTHVSFVVEITTKWGRNCPSVFDNATSFPFFLFFPRINRCS